ncbi:polynucleotide kinase-phosphatase [Candidatus Poribacteria bacterium]|nr:polynucleotide kinase-phosphatase [Candidatus Poribacteria bacterium]
MQIRIPNPSLVILIGPSGSGKTTFAKQHFKATEILSSDFCRGIVSDDENDQSATEDAFDVLHYIASKRLAAGKLTVIDATNVQAEARKKLHDLARKYHYLSVGIVMNLSARVCQQRNDDRDDRNFQPYVIRKQISQLRRSIRSLRREGFRNFVHILSSPEEVESVEIERQPLWTNLKNEHGPFDIIGDVHGCFDELTTLLRKLGYEISLEQGIPITHQQGRKVVFLGDYVDRGPDVVNVMKLVMKMHSDGIALCVPGNHDVRLVRALRGKNVNPTYGLAESLSQLENETEEFKTEIAEFIEGLISHYELDDGKLVVAHAGMKEEFQGRASGRVREFALYGESTGEVDEFGLPIRLDWAEEYRGSANVVYGHTTVYEPQWINRTINIDTGCVFGGKLTALQYPEKELVSVPALQTYSEPPKPLIPDESSTNLDGQYLDEGVLDIKDVIGKRIISTKLNRNITIREENTIPALESMSRFAVDPKWLIYLPPTMSPSETSSKPEFLEHPTEAFNYYRRQDVSTVIWQEKHMGSRAIVIVCKNQTVVQKRFGITSESIGICYTRNGRHFFDENNLETQLLNQLKQAIDDLDYWEKFDTDWFCLDCELMPWSVKAQELIHQQYAPVGIAGNISISDTLASIKMANERGVDTNGRLDDYIIRKNAVSGYIKSYQQYCWDVDSISDLKLAPFHLLATEGNVYFSKDHLWHMDVLQKICQKSNGDILFSTTFDTVSLSDELSEKAAIQIWEEITSEGGEGFVVKPLDFITHGKKGIVQPAVKCRGREYLRIIYGPEYTMPRYIERLRSRGLSKKRSLAIREFTLGVEALERFVNNEPFSKVHECVFGILALESEPVDPRL